MHQQTALMISLGMYDPGCAFDGNLQTVLRDQPRLAGGADAVLSMVNDGEIVLILDGLDEFARNHGEEPCRSLFVELEQIWISQRESRRLVSRPYLQTLVSKGVASGTGNVSACRGVTPQRRAGEGCDRKAIRRR